MNVDQVLKIPFYVISMCFQPFSPLAEDITNYFTGKNPDIQLNEK